MAGTAVTGAAAAEEDRPGRAESEDPQAPAASATSSAALTVLIFRAARPDDARTGPRRAAVPVTTGPYYRKYVVLSSSPHQQ